MRSELSVSDGLVLKNNRIVIPTVLRKEMLQKVHTGHLGIEKCQDRAKQFMVLAGNECRYHRNGECVRNMYETSSETGLGTA